MTIVTNGSLSDMAGIDNEFYKLGCISGILSGTILVIDMVRTIGGRNEYFHTVLRAEHPFIEQIATQIKRQYLPEN